MTRGSEWVTKTLFALGAAVLCASLFIPYWRLRVVAPQYPKGLALVVYLNRISGDTQEINTLNHYIGMRRIDEVAKTERRIAVPGMLLVVAGLLAALFFKGRWSSLFAIPALVFPPVFVADLYWRLLDSGLNLNPRAPLSSSVKPFIPPLFGYGKVAQFHAFAQFDHGFYLSVIASVLAFIGLWIRFGNLRQRMKCCILAVLAGSIIFAFAPPGFAETLIVSPEGPYLEIQEALKDVKDQDTVLVRKGVYRGPFIVEKSIRLIGENRPVMDGLGKGTVIKLLAPNVLLKGFMIKNSGSILSRDDAGLYAAGENTIIEDNQFEDVLFGIYLSRASGSIVRGNILRGKSVTVARRGDLIRVWYSDRILIEKNQAFEGRDSVIWYSKDSVIRDNVFKGGRYGLHFMYCDRAIVEHNRLEANSVGAYLMYSSNIRLRFNQIISNRGPSGYGLGFKDIDGAHIVDNTIADNRSGLYLDGAAGIYQRNIIAYNDIGIQMLTTASRNRFTQNSFIDNGEQILIEGMSYLTSNEWDGNFWSDYRGYDFNGDGTGDIAYHAMQFFERITDRYHALRFFRSSPSAQALELATVVFPVFGPKPKFTDPNPRIHPIAPTTKSVSAVSWTWVAFSGFLLMVPLGFLLTEAQFQRTSYDYH